MKRLTLYLFISLVFISCNKNLDETKAEEKKVDQLLESIKYSNSPRITIKYCKDIIKIDPKNGEAYYKLAEAYKDMASFVVETEEEKDYYKKLSSEYYEIAKKYGYENSND